jgi:hypothetical protein
MGVQNLVEKLRLVPGAHIDSGFRQSRETLLKQLELRARRDQSGMIDIAVSRMQTEVDHLRQQCVPYNIPDEYISFLEYYGGLMIESRRHYFSIYGIGPMVEEWYSSIQSDETLHNPGKYGFLSLGVTSFRKGHHFEYQSVDFVLDLAGVIQKAAVIGIGPWEGGVFNLTDVVKDIASFSGRWVQIADSFSTWLEEAARTEGSFNYE